MGLILKCILKLTKGLNQIMDSLKPEEILLKCHSYLVEFGPHIDKINDDICVKTIKTIINEFGKFYQEKLWDFYATSIQDHEAEDNYISKWIDIVLKLSPHSKSGTVSVDKKPTVLNFENLIKEPTQDWTEIEEVARAIENVKQNTNMEESINNLYQTLLRYPSK